MQERSKLFVFHLTNLSGYFLRYKESISVIFLIKKKLTMNKLFTGLLIIAIGAGAFFLLRKKDNLDSGKVINKEMLIGKWKIDSLTVEKDSLKKDLARLLLFMDSSDKKRVFDFRDNGQVLISLRSDSLAGRDTSSYKWGKENDLLVKDNASDTTDELMKVLRLSKEKFVVQSKDSLKIYFSRVD